MENVIALPSFQGNDDFVNITVSEHEGSLRRVQVTMSVNREEYILESNIVVTDVKNIDAVVELLTGLFGPKALLGETTGS